MSRDTTRRSVLKAGTTVAVLSALPTAAGASRAGAWSTAETPTANTLHDVIHAADGAYAVGGGGYVLERTGTGWQTVTRNGPAGDGSDLYGVDATANGRRLWIVGASGAIGVYDVGEGTIADRSQPNDVSNNFNDVAVPRGSCGTVYVAGDSGAIYYSFDGGADGTWNSVTPGSGASIEAIDVYGARAGHAFDSNQKVFRTTDGETWTEMGIESADSSLLGLDSDGAGDVSVSAAGGTVHVWNGSAWTSERAHVSDLNDVEAAGTPALAVGAGGTIVRRSASGWAQEPATTEENLEAVTEPDEDPEIAVGAGGTIVER